METPGGSGSGLGRRAAAGLFWLALAAASVAAFTLAGGSGAFQLGSIRISVRSPVNPLIGTAAFAALGAWLVGPTAFVAQGRRLESVVRRRAWALALAAAVVVLWLTLGLGSLVAGSADASGYLNEARLWGRGSLRVGPRAVPVAFVHDLQPLAPLGFRPSPEGDVLVPTYPPGLPLAMAAFNRLAGQGAEFLVVPLSASVVTFLAFVLGRQLGGSMSGLLASAMTAASPTVLFQSLQPMSDVPAACALTLALVWLANPTPGAALGAGAAASAACLIRPNLFALVPLLGMAAIWWEPARRRGLVRAAALVTPPLVAALAFAVWQRQLYGGVTETGYGAVDSLFALQHIGPNLRRYPAWLVGLHGYTVLLALFGPVLIARGAACPSLERRRAVRVAWSGLALSCGLLALYLLYAPFDSWAFLRFLLPALPAVFALAGVAMVGLIDRIAAPVRPIVWLLVLVGVTSWEVARAREVGVFGVQRSEDRYVQVADFANAQAEPSVFMSMQHSGSLTYYTARPIVRWDWIEPTEIDHVVDELAAHGHGVFVVLDDWEQPELRRRFAGSRLVTSLDEPVFTVRIGETTRTSVYRVASGPPSLPTGS
jgi:hypothetical protein